MSIKIDILQPNILYPHFNMKNPLLEPLLSETALLATNKRFQLKKKKTKFYPNKSNQKKTPIVKIPLIGFLKLQVVDGMDLHKKEFLSMKLIKNGKDKKLEWRRWLRNNLI